MKLIVQPAVSRTADDPVRHHAKMMIVDRRVLHVYGFNVTSLDIEGSNFFTVAGEADASPTDSRT